MNAILESVAARAANGWQRAGAKFDFEVLAMPGGSVMAPALWVYSMVASVLKRPPQDSTDTQSAPDVPQEPPGLHCDWSGCRCT
jgi:hypothetical protein